MIFAINYTIIRHFMMVCVLELSTLNTLLIFLHLSRPYLHFLVHFFRRNLFYLHDCYTIFHEMFSLRYHTPFSLSICSWYLFPSSYFQHLALEIQFLFPPSPLSPNIRLVSYICTCYIFLPLFCGIEFAFTLLRLLPLGFLSRLRTIVLSHLYLPDCIHSLLGISTYFANSLLWLLLLLSLSSKCSNPLGSLFLPHASLLSDLIWTLSDSFLYLLILYIVESIFLNLNTNLYVSA